MKKFNYNDELRDIIDTKRLVEINLGLSSPLDHCIAYLLDANDDYLTFARISNDIALQGITICRMDDMEAIEADTGFINELQKGITNNSLHTEVSDDIKGVKEFSFKGFISAFEATKTIIDITSENRSFTGRLAGYDKKILAIDEYYAEDNKRFSRTYINPANITAITVSGTWLKIISRSLTDNNI
ncbi:MAG: hypothetical protein M3Q81_01060 [bacterium]|nr:hypothetical protein [bacterium]